MHAKVLCREPGKTSGDAEGTTVPRTLQKTEEKDELELVKVEQVEVEPGCVYTSRTYRPRGKKQEEVEEGGHSSRKRESYMELEFREEPIQPPARVQGEAGGAGATPGAEEEVIEVARKRKGGQATLRQKVSQYLPPNPKLRRLPEDIGRRKRIAADPAFLTQLKRNVKRRCEELKDWLQEPEVNPENSMAITMLASKQLKIMTLQDAINRVRDGCYHML